MRVTNRQVLENAVKEIQGDFTTAQCCDKIRDLSPATTLSYQEVSHNLKRIPGISIKGKILVVYGYGSRTVNLYSRD